MKIAILGTGKEGQSARNYLLSQYPEAEISEFQDFDEYKIKHFELRDYDVIIRSPSVPPRWLAAAGARTWTSVTQIFFEQCPRQIIGVTGTKGKGTTSSLITEILRGLGKKVHLVGNIGSPALDVLSEIQLDDVVVYEMSSFQLWDLTHPPKVAVVLGIEPDHLNVHEDYQDYVAAKGNIARYQGEKDSLIYNVLTEKSQKIGELGVAKKHPYPIAAEERPAGLDEVLGTLSIPGKHNQENAEAALLAVAAYMDLELADFLEKYKTELVEVFSNFKGLPHRLEYLREIDGVKYYDDNFSTNVASTKVAIDAFPGQRIVLIMGGRDKTDYEDLPEIVEMIKSRPNVKKIVLIGESGRELLPQLENAVYAESLKEAVDTARKLAEELMTDWKMDGATDSSVVLLMSPSAASFDMFQNVYDRGAQYQEIVKGLA